MDANNNSFDLIIYILARENYERTDDPVELEYLKDRVINELFNSDTSLSAN